mmetsp:Transcript_29149/g.45614  ORF Transcript_29149/g.45614 Transcript_29149/m.45614 type:complete len:494 (-) Transcript_29149:56-1537(-)
MGDATRMNRRPLSAPCGSMGRGMPTRNSPAARIAMRMEIDAAAMEVAALQQRLGNWNARLAPHGQGVTSGVERTTSSPILPCGGAQAHNPSDVGFKLIPIDEVLGKPPQGKSSDAIASAQSDNKPSRAQEWKSPTVGRRPGAHPRRASSWQRHRRNRPGCSPEVRLRERSRLEKVVKRCGLVLEPDPSAPNKEMLRVAPVEKLRRSCKEQRHATQRLVEGLSVAAQSNSGGLSALSRAHALLQAEQRRLAGLPSRPSSASSASALGSRSYTEAAQHRPPSRANSNLGLTMRRGDTEHLDDAALQDMPLYVTSTSAPCSPRSEANLTHTLPTKHSTSVLRAAQQGKVLVHLTGNNPTSGREDYGPPPKSLQDAILAAALCGAIPVRSITAAVTKLAGGKFKAAAFISTSVGPSEISALGSARSSDLDSNYLDDQFINPGGIASEPSSESERDGETHDAQEQETFAATHQDIMELQQFRRPPALVHERRDRQFDG